MKILWVLDNINTLNGMVQVVIGLSNYFSEKGNAVQICSFFSKESHPFFKLNPEVTVNHLGENWNTCSRMDKHRLLGQIMESSDADILLTCNEWAHTAAVLNKRKFGGKLILTQHLSCDKFTTRRKILNCILHRFADVVAVLTEADKAFYKKYGVCNVHVIPNAIYNAAKEQQRKQNLVCSVGRVETVKGFDMLISAFSRIAGEFSDWKLRIWGDGSQRKVLLAQIEELGLSHQIELPGVTDRVAEELAQSSVFAMSSRWEGFPLALVEAMAAGNAIVAFDLPFTKDILNDGSAIIVPKNDVAALADALRRMMSDEALRKTYGAGAYAASQKYSIENIGQMWFALFADSLFRKKSHR